MKLKWLPAALANLDHVAAHVGKENPAAAARIILKIRDAADGLRTWPRRGRPGRVIGTRELVIANTPYFVVYRVRRGRIEVIRVLHGRQKWPAAPPRYV